jgi:hypothetical protein
MMVGVVPIMVAVFVASRFVVLVIVGPVGVAVVLVAMVITSVVMVVAR